MSEAEIEKHNKSVIPTLATLPVDKLFIGMEVVAMPTGRQGKIVALFDKEQFSPHRTSDPYGWIIEEDTEIEIRWNDKNNKDYSRIYHFQATEIRQK